MRWFFAFALGSLGDPGAVPPLIAAMGDEDSSVRWSAASALGSLGDPGAVPPLITALGDGDSSVRVMLPLRWGAWATPVRYRP